MDITDFRNAHVINTAAIDGQDVNTCRTRIIARCQIAHTPSGRTEDFFLGKACIGEHMYLDGQITQEPTSEVAIIFSRNIYKLVKKFADHRDDVVQVACPTDQARLFDGRLATWTDLQFRLTVAQARRLDDTAEVIDATREGAPLVGRTFLDSEDGAWQAVIEYPIEYMNVHPPTSSFSVDVGPILFPDFSAAGDPWIGMLELAFILYKSREHVEFVVRVPSSLANGSVSTLHYSRVVHHNARSELFGLEA